jgi:hypothetical protein
MFGLTLSPVMDVAVARGMRNVHVMSPNAAGILADIAASRQIHSAWVEGFAGAGKSSFAAALAGQLGWRHIDVDAFSIDDASVASSEGIDRAKLRDAIGSGTGVVLEGVCLRDIVALEHMDPLKVYVARVSLDGNRYLWHDAIEMEDPGSEKATDRRFQAVAAYHRRVRPHADADYTFLRVQL